MIPDSLPSPSAPAGEQVPSLDLLAREYNVSRATAQKALRVLREEGTVETRPRWGTFVADRS